ncbi:hypothetical protein VNO77_22841 [Canavalia gladiata]|uniref:Uncharacterized protein n=1 Tax=Canavalia gladiata TaxID=3824 RepID=A0AAN9L3V2_CANGL
MCSLVFEPRVVKLQANSWAAVDSNLGLEDSALARSICSSFFKGPVVVLAKIEATFQAPRESPEEAKKKPLNSISIPFFLTYVVTALDMAPLIKRDPELLQFKLKELN